MEALSVVEVRRKRAPRIRLSEYPLQGDRFVSIPARHRGQASAMRRRASTATTNSGRCRVKSAMNRKRISRFMAREPPDATHWSLRAISRAIPRALDHSSHAALQPHRSETFKLSSVPSSWRSAHRGLNWRRRIVPVLKTTKRARSRPWTVLTPLPMRRMRGAAQPRLQ